MKKVILLGASGSIGRQTIEIIKENKDLYELVCISVGYNISKLIEILDVFSSIKEVALLDEKSKDILEKKYPNISFHYHEEGILKLLDYHDYDIVLNAIVGFAGLKSSIKAIEKDKILALANKETMVVAGEYINKLLLEHPKSKILPVDSEHCAIYQCLDKTNKDELNKLIITASGGAFRDKTLAELSNVSIDDALNHPNWSMGASITVDSATMLNKGLEVIEAHHLFNVPYESIDVVLHYESIVHSMVEFKDSSILAQLSLPNMKQPINYCLGYPNRIKYTQSSIDFSKMLNLTFKPIDLVRFEGLALAINAGKKGHTYPCVLNASKEVATNAFLNNKIKFLDITKLVKIALEKHQVITNPTLDDLFKTDQKTRVFIEELIMKGDF
ncbi:MAG: 1-deoxy-D-xylulose-5-phosphate reductoisomerase [Bacilli bacterium]|jgi:1-deoxy-D-xylulose-5-phosphate reductoisomerase|nr:1-deoxy-D-xylulose-5-phosphate reductoisomerase [Bacilli bacterium]